MTKQDVLRELCSIVGLVYEALDDYSEPSDGFCDRCPWHDQPDRFQHSGRTVEWVRAAVVEKLKRDGKAIPDGFDPETGREIHTEVTEEQRAERKRQALMLDDMNSLLKAMTGGGA